MPGDCEEVENAARSALVLIKIRKGVIVQNEDECPEWPLHYTAKDCTLGVGVCNAVRMRTYPYGGQGTLGLRFDAVHQALGQEDIVLRNGFQRECHFSEDELIQGLGCGSVEEQA